VARASSSKKVQRAARAAASSKGASERRNLGFPLVVAIVVVLGIVLVIFARGSRDPLISPTTDDHWHSAYTIYNCGEQMPRFQGQDDPDGIHSHGDSLIHIHPFNSSATGEDARLGVFLNTMNAAINADGIFANSGEFPAILAADGCAGEPGVIKVARWSLSLNADPELVEVYEDGFDDIRLLGDGEGFSFALVAVGDDPPPPAQESVGSLVGVGSELEWQGTDPSIPLDPSLTPVTPEPATPDSETPEPVTPEPVTPEPVTPEPVTPEPVTPDPATPEPVTPDPATPDSETPDPVTPEPATPDSETPEPATPEPATSEPATSEPATPEPATSEPATPEPVTPEPVAPDSETSSSVAPDSSVAESSAPLEPTSDGADVDAPVDVVGSDGSDG